MLFRLFRRSHTNPLAISGPNTALLRVEVLEDRALPQGTPLGSLVNHSAAPVHVAAPLGILESHRPTAAPAKSAATTHPAILAEGATWLPSTNGPQQAIIQGPAQLLADTGLTTTQLAALLNVTSINWKQEMVVLVSEGRETVNAHTPSVQISGLDVTHGVLTVNWNYEEINPNSIAPGVAVQTDPAGIALVKRFTGPTQFLRSPTVILPLPPLVTTDPVPLM